MRILTCLLVLAWCLVIMASSMMAVPRIIIYNPDLSPGLGVVPGDHDLQYDGCPQYLRVLVIHPVLECSQLVPTAHNTKFK